MNTREIESTLRGCVKNFDGVFSVDTLPDEPHLLVCNTDPSDRPGRHWVCIFVDDENGRGEFFDSFGRGPDTLMERYMNGHCYSWSYNRRQLQSVVSRFCGHYCIYYCMLKGRGIDLYKIAASFTSDTGLNDMLVHNFVCRLINK